MQLFVNFVLYGIYPLNHILIFFSRTRGSCRCWGTRPCWPPCPCPSCFCSSLGWRRTHISQLHCSLPQIEARGFCRRCECRPCSWSCSSPAWGRMPSCRSSWCNCLRKGWLPRLLLSIFFSFSFLSPLPPNFVHIWKKDLLKLIELTWAMHVEWISPNKE